MGDLNLFCQLEQFFTSDRASCRGSRQSRAVVTRSTSMFCFVTKGVITLLVTKEKIEVELTATGMILTEKVRFTPFGYYTQKFFDSRLA